mgnify:CR=1 FL=1
MQEVAIHQLDRAIDLFTQEQDIICATTLAGASEEIFGKLLEEIGGQSWLKEHIDLCLDLLGHAGHPEIKEKDILVFKHDNIIVIHRVIKILVVNGETFYYTKGDNNDTEDGYPIAESQVVGIYLFKIPFIGYPTVEFNELTKK